MVVDQRGHARAGKCLRIDVEEHLFHGRQPVRHHDCRAWYRHPWAKEPPSDGRTSRLELDVLGEKGHQDEATGFDPEPTAIVPTPCRNTRGTTRQPQADLMPLLRARPVG